MIVFTCLCGFFFFFLVYTCVCVVEVVCVCVLSIPVAEHLNAHSDREEWQAVQTNNQQPTARAPNSVGLVFYHTSANTLTQTHENKNKKQM